MCDPHNEFMRGSFTVASGPAPPHRLRPRLRPRLRRPRRLGYSIATVRSNYTIDVKTPSGQKVDTVKPGAVHDRGPGPVERAQLPPPGVGREQDDDGRLRRDAEVVGHARAGHVSLPVRSARDDDEGSPDRHRRPLRGRRRSADSGFDARAAAQSSASRSIRPSRRASSFCGARESSRASRASSAPDRTSSACARARPVATSSG